VSERRVRFEISQAGGRLDLALAARIPELSRTRLQKLIRQGLVVVNGVTVIKPGFRLGGGEAVEVLIPATTSSELRAERIPLDIIFENEDLMLVNKPAGMVVHPSAGHETGTLINAALAHAPDMAGIGGEFRPGLVHRLDKDTSGLIVLAKNDATLQVLQQQFKERQVNKVYIALVDGHPPTPEGRVDASIGRDPRHRQRMAAVHPGKGREAVTVYQTLKTFPEHTLLEVHPITGRTHQIRIHLAFIGCPIMGDKVYGHRNPTVPIERHFLHAAGLTLMLPGETSPHSFEAQLPNELEIVLKDLSSR
jgi:23S rRNA pseudouridine1911/1915/1917 synthase